MPDAGIFARHLDLTPLRGHARGLVRCIFHDGDRTPSLSVDLERGVWHCFGCGAQGGVLAFARRVGEAAPDSGVRGRLKGYAPDGLDYARRQPWYRAQEMYELADLQYVADQARRHATDTAEGWEILARAAWMDTEAEALRADL